MTAFHLGLPIDHVGLVTRDLDRLETRYRQLGFYIAPRQALHTSSRPDQAPQDVGQYSAHLIFQQGYLELTSVPDTTTSMHLTPYLGRPDGVQIVAIQADSASESHERMGRIGLTPSALTTSSRMISYGSGGEARFRWFMLSPAEFPEALICWVEHLTPDLIYQPEVMRHANGVQKLTEVLMVVDDVTESQSRYANMAEQTASVPPKMLPALSLLSHDDIQQRFEGIRIATTNGVMGLIFEVDNLTQTTEYFRQQGLLVHNKGHREAWIAPDTAGGVALCFQSAHPSSST